MNLSRKLFSMNKTTIDILHYLYYNSSDYDFVSLYQLEVLIGISGGDLRSFLEDLKDQCLVVETDDGFNISRQGRHFGQSRWA